MAISSTSRCFPGHTGTGTIWIVNGEGYASATENVASAAVTLNSSTVISAASFTAATEQTEASVSFVSGNNPMLLTTTGNVDVVTIYVLEDL